MPKITLSRMTGYQSSTVKKEAKKHTKTQKKLEETNQKIAEVQKVRAEAQAKMASDQLAIDKSKVAQTEARGRLIGNLNKIIDFIENLKIQIQPFQGNEVLISKMNAFIADIQTTKTLPAGPLIDQKVDQYQAQMGVLIAEIQQLAASQPD